MSEADKDKQSAPVEKPISASLQTIEVKRDRADKSPLKITYDFGADINDAIAKFDGTAQLDRVVFDLFRTAAKAQLTGYVQKLLESENEETKKPYTSAQIHKLVLAWKPTTNRRAKANVDRMVLKVKSLSPAEKAALRAQLDMD